MDADEYLTEEQLQQNYYHDNIESAIQQLALYHPELHIHDKLREEIDSRMEQAYKDFSDAVYKVTQSSMLAILLSTSDACEIAELLYSSDWDQTDLFHLKLSMENEKNPAVLACKDSLIRGIISFHDDFGLPGSTMCRLSGWTMCRKYAEKNPAECNLGRGLDILKAACCVSFDVLRRGKQNEEKLEMFQQLLNLLRPEQCTADNIKHLAKTIETLIRCYRDNRWYHHQLVDILESVKESVGKIMKKKMWKDQ